jgi:creatinine amidohydrolase
MRFEDLNWMDVERYLEQDDRLILVLGSCEQHAYLSLLTDVKIPLALADSASTRTGVLVAPTLNFGVSPYFLAYPGTLSLSVSTMILAVEDIVRSAYRHGFRRILFINGHGGNDPVRLHLHQINNELIDLKFQWYEWWKSHSVAAVAIRHNIKPGHANWLEAFSFTVVATLPHESKIPPKTPSAVIDAGTLREVYGDGSFGGPYQVDGEIMQEILDAALEDILLLLEFDESGLT